MTFDLADAFARHAVRVRHANLSPGAITAAKTFLLDTLGVALAGSSGANVHTVLDLAVRHLQQSSDHGGLRLPPRHGGIEGGMAAAPCQRLPGRAGPGYGADNAAVLAEAGYT